MTGGGGRERPHRVGREHTNHRSEWPAWARTLDGEVVQVAEFALRFIPANSTCTPEEVFREYTGGSVQPSLFFFLYKVLYEWVAVALVDDPGTAQDNVGDAKKLLRLFFNKADPQACLAS